MQLDRQAGSWCLVPELLEPWCCDGLHLYSAAIYCRTAERFLAWGENIARAASTLWSRGSWLGEPRFPHCAFVASWLIDCCMAFSCFCLFALVFLCHTNPKGDTMLSSPDTFQMTMNWLADHRPCFFFWVVSCLVFGLCVLVLFCFCVVFLVCFLLVGFLSSTVTAQWIMYRSFSVLLLVHIVDFMMLLLH